MRKKCQVCDGPITNGRCKYCGMPYRNDIELYYLNENRSEHYHHTSAKVQGSMKKIANAHTTRTYGTRQIAIQNEKQKKKSKKSVCFFWILLAVFAVMAEYAPDYLNDIGYRIGSFVEDKLGVLIEDLLIGSEAEKIESEDVGNDGKDAGVEIIEPVGEIKTVKFDKSKQQEKVELYTENQMETVSSDSQYNYLAVYEIQQYDE